MITTKEHFIYFEKRMKFWLEKLCLTGWAVTINHSFINNSNGGCILGNCFRDNDSKRGVINLAKDWMGESITKTRLNEVALHECLELLLCEMNELIFCRCLDNQRVEPATHTIIQSILHALLPSEEKKTYRRGVQKVQVSKKAKVHKHPTKKQIKKAVKSVTEKRVKKAKKVAK